MTRHARGSSFLTRRDFNRATFAGAASLALTKASLAADQPPAKQTFVYKTVGQHEIKADVYSGQGEGPRPVVLWIHGGAVISGNREGMLPDFNQRLNQAGYTVVSIDYRLAPETKLPEIFGDVKDACRWIRQQGPKLFNAASDRLVVSGGSAGGFLTLATGFIVEPRPVALVPFWGYGDVSTAWLSRPDPFYSKQPAVPEAEARGAVGSEPISYPVPGNKRGRFYLYCRQNGIWPREVTGYDPDKEPRAFDAFCPIRNVSPKYPPTLFVHGDRDTDVPYEQSVLMAAELKRQGVEHELITIAGGGHGLGGVDRQIVSQTFDRAVEFIKKHLS